MIHRLEKAGLDGWQPITPTAGAKYWDTCTVGQAIYQTREVA